MMGKNLLGRSLRAAVVATVALVSGASFAQRSNVPFPRLNIERFTLNPAAQDSLVVDMGELLPEGASRVGLGFQFASGPSVTRVGGDYASLRLDSRMIGHLTGAFAANKWIQIEAQIPVIFNQSESQALVDKGFAPIAANGFGAPVLTARAGLLRQNEGMPVDLAVSASVGLPFGDQAALAQDNEVPFRPAVSVGRDFGRVKVGGSLYAQFRSQENFGYRGVSSSDLDTVEHEVGLALAASGEIVPKLRGEIGLVSDFALDVGGNSTQTYLGLRYQALPRMEVFALAGPAFGDLVGTAQFRALGGVAFAFGDTQPKKETPPGPPKVVDTDADGIADAKDACPGEAEDDDGFQDEDGCPDPDNDGDGLADAKDACPNEPGEAHRAGCPIPDRDGDKVADEIDRCPDVAGEIAENGCPPKDTDEDGIADRDDLCPTKASHGGANKGCPDTDEDGIADNEDHCISEKGVAENKGCPARKKQLVVIEREKQKLEIREKVHFTSGKATLRKGPTYVLLNEVARVLNEHPEIAKVVIEGHTDDVGNDEKNMKLSQQRAETVMKYLIDKGVDPSRLEAKGYGETRPLVPNVNKSNRETNRRVEFTIVDTPAPAPTSSLVEPLVN